MYERKKRWSAVAVLALAFASVPAMAAISPAHAGTSCESVPGPTPSVEADLDGDGRPDVRVQSLRDVEVCATADVFLDTNPVQVENCHPWGWIGCYKILVHAQAGVGLDTAVSLCRTTDGVRTCTILDQYPWTYYTPDTPVMCIGIDLEGTSPCSHGGLLGFE